MKPVKSFLSGLGFMLDGFRVFKQFPSLLPFVIIPFVINTVIFIVGIYFGSAWVAMFVAWALGFIITPAAGVWYSLLYYPILILLWIAFLVLMGYLIFIVGTLIASPFHSLLAERTLMKLGALQTQPFKLVGWIKTTLRTHLTALVKLLVFAVFGVVIYVLSWIPGLNLVAWFLASLVVAFDAMDYSFEAKTWGFRTRIAFFKSEFPLFSGMALGMGLTLLIPGLTLLLYPLAVTGAAFQMAQSDRLQKGV